VEIGTNATRRIHVDRCDESEREINREGVDFTIIPLPSQEDFDMEGIEDAPRAEGEDKKSVTTTTSRAEHRDCSDTERVGQITPEYRTQLEIESEILKEQILKSSMCKTPTRPMSESQPEPGCVVPPRKIENRHTPRACHHSLKGACEFRHNAGISTLDMCTQSRG
jgi:hypothetical protein